MDLARQLARTHIFSFVEAALKEVREIFERELGLFHT
jgi:hypothetical protein